MVLDYGIVFSIIVLLAYTITLIKNYKERNYWLIVIILFILIWCIIEQNIINIWRNVFILSFIPLLEYKSIKILDYNNIKKKIKRMKNIKNEPINN